MMASKLPLLASLRAAEGISHAPGTRRISTSSLLAPLRNSASREPCSSRSVMTAFHRDATIAKRMPFAERSPSRAIGFPLSGSLHSQNMMEKPVIGAAVKYREPQVLSAISLTVVGELLALSLSEDSTI